MSLRKLEKANKKNPHVERLEHQYNRAHPVKHYSAHGTILVAGSYGNFRLHDSPLMGGANDPMGLLAPPSPQELQEARSVVTSDPNEWPQVKQRLISNVMTNMDAEEIAQVFDVAQSVREAEKEARQAFVADPKHAKDFKKLREVAAQQIEEAQKQERLASLAKDNPLDTESEEFKQARKVELLQRQMADEAVEQGAEDLEAMSSAALSSVLEALADEGRIGNKATQDAQAASSGKKSVEDQVAEMVADSPAPTDAPKSVEVSEESKSNEQIAQEILDSMFTVEAARVDAEADIEARVTTAQREVLERQLKGIFRKMKDHKKKSDEELDLLVAEYMQNSQICALANAEGEEGPVPGCDEVSMHNKTAFYPEGSNFEQLTGRMDADQDRAGLKRLAVWWSRYNSGIAKKDAERLATGMKGNDHLFHLVEGSGRHRSQKDCKYGVRKSGPLDNKGRRLCKKKPGSKSRSRKSKKSKASRSPRRTLARCKYGVSTNSRRPNISSGPNKGKRPCRRQRSRSLPRRTRRSPSRR